MTTADWLEAAEQRTTRIMAEAERIKALGEASETVAPTRSTSR